MTFRYDELTWGREDCGVCEGSGWYSVDTSDGRRSAECDCVFTGEPCADDDRARA